MLQSFEEIMLNRLTLTQIPCHCIE